MRKLEEIKIECYKENGKVPFSAVIKFDDNTELATQGNNYPELMKNIGDLLMIKLENDSEVQSFYAPEKSKSVIKEEK